MVAYDHYRHSPTEATRRELHDAELGDWRDIALFEAGLAGFCGVTLLVYLRATKRAEQNEN